MKNAKVFIGQLPRSDQKCCSNCKSFWLHGVVTGYCDRKCKDMQAGQSCSKFEMETEERKKEKEL